MLVLCHNGKLLFIILFHFKNVTFYMTTKCVWISTSLLRQTRHMFNKDTFKMMKKNAILVNSGRGGVINHDDLADALKNGVIAGAGLDTTEPPSHPLVNMPNCVVLPHMGSNVWEARNAMASIAARSAIAGVEGGTPEGLVKSNF